MPNNNYYRQCVLVKGETHEIVWIPEEFALAGKYLRIEDENGWQVKEVAGRQREDYLQAHERDHLGHRFRTDV